MSTDMWRLFDAALSKIDKSTCHMSSLASPVQTQAAPTKMAKSDEKKLVRSSSIEKIRRFNSYLCTQHYCLVPAILAWLRSSQDVLHQAAEKTILDFRAIILNTIVYRLVQLSCKSVSPRTIADGIRTATQRLLTALAESYRHYDVDTKFLKALIYLTVLVLTCQLSFCIFVVCSTTVPIGLGFLLLCTVNIIAMYFRATFFFLATTASSKRPSRYKIKAN